MSSVNTLTLVLIFLVGAATGGLLVAIARYAAMDRIRQQFRAELEAILSQHSALPPRESKGSPQSDINPEYPKPPGRVA